jgi:hypothetical protein
MPNEKWFMNSLTSNLQIAYPKSGWKSVFVRCFNLERKRNYQKLMLSNFKGNYADFSAG